VRNNRRLGVAPVSRRAGPPTAGALRLAPGRLLVLAAGMALTMLAGSRGLRAQAPAPALYPSPTITSTPGLTNVGTAHYVDNGLIYMGPQNVRYPTTLMIPSRTSLARTRAQSRSSHAVPAPRPAVRLLGWV
jgi:hypothetical protein